MDQGAKPTVMIVEDDEDIGHVIARRLRADGFETEVAVAPDDVVNRLDAGQADWDVVILDVGLPGTSGIDVLRRFRERGSISSVIMLTGDQTANTATTCMRAGAFYYLTKPFEAFEVSAVVQSAARHTMVRRELQASRHRTDRESLLVGSSAAMRKLRTTLERLATQEVPVLVRGESGTGKELIARTLHETSPRRRKRFVAVNCGAIPESLIDSELFGHRKGAFTGATADRAGVFVEADGGTLFLDEIGDMPMPVQARLLRVLQESEVRPVGGDGTSKVSVRVIAATHVDLQVAVERERFREDLYYRLNVVVLHAPPLRDRTEDLALLAAHFLRKHGGEHPPSLSPDALDALAAYSWPGNVRELENAILHAIALRHGDDIGPESLPAHIGLRRRDAQLAIAYHTDAELPPLNEAKRIATAEFERSYLELAMERARGSVSTAARLAGVDRTNFRRLLQRHKIAGRDSK